MKKIYSYITLLFVAMLVGVSCSSNVEKIYVDGPDTATESTLTIDGNSVVTPTEDNFDVFPLVFNWTKTLFGGPEIPVSYTLQIDTTVEFQDAIEFSVGTNLLSKAFTNKQLNDWGLSFQDDVTDPQPVDLFVRIAATVYSASSGFVIPPDSVYSNYVTINITPIISEAPVIYVPGNHQGWKPEEAPTLSSENRDSIFTGYIALNGEFKFTSQPNWDGPNYGAGAKEGELSDDGGAGNLDAPKGYYYIVVNLNTMTYTLTKTEMVLYVPGNHQGWNPSDAPTLQSENYDNIYTGTVALDGEFKFTSEPSWDGINYGAGSSEGTLSDDSGAGNLNAPAGTYDIEVNLNKMTYKLTLK